MAKILFISNLYPPHSVGGYEIVAFQIASGLIEKNQDVTVLTSNYRNKSKLSADQAVIRKLKIVPFSQEIKRISYLSSIFLWLYNLLYTYYIIKKKSPDLIVIWSLRNVGIVPLHVSLFCGKPIVLCLHSYWFLTELKNNRKWLIQNAIMVSQTVLERHLEKGFNPQNVQVIPNGIDSSNIKERANTSIKKLLYVGRLSPEKGVDVLIEALSLIDYDQFPELSLSIAGSGDKDYIALLKSKIDPRLKDRIQFIGEIEHKQIWTIYDKHDLLIVPSIWEEPFGLIIIEAMARGLIVLASDIGGPKEIITDNINGFLVEPNQPALIKIKIEHILKNQNNLTEIRKKIYKSVSNKYILNKTIDEYEKFFLKIIKNAEP